MAEESGDRRCEKDGGGLHAGLIYAHRPATSDKSLTPRHYLFELARARTFLLKVPVKMIPPR